MPLSKKYNILLIHIPKNGGKTLEIIFDIHNSYRGSPNARSKFNAFFKLMLNITGTKNAYTSLMGVVDKSYTAQHLTLQEIQLGNWLNKEYLNSLIKITTVRDPYDRAYSLFNHWDRKVIKTEESVESQFFQFLNTIETRRDSKKHNEASHFRMQIEYLRDVSGSTNKVELVRLEKISEDLEQFITKYNLDIDFKAKLKATKYESNVSLKERTKSERNISKVYELFKEDYKLLGYDLMTSTL